MMFYRGAQSFNPIPTLPYFVRGMGRGYHHGDAGYNPPPPPPPNEGGFFGGGALTSFIFGGIAGAVLANVFDQKQVNAQAVPYSAQPIPVATPVPYYPPYAPQPHQSQLVSQGGSSQGYNQFMNQPHVSSNTQVLTNGQQPMVTQSGVMANPTFSQVSPASGQPMTTVMPYYMFPVQQQPHF